MTATPFDVVVIGGGPAGQKAAVQAAKLGQRVLLIERSKSTGGACVRYGTIPSKTLRETALAIGKFRRLTGQVLEIALPEHLQISSLMTRKEQVVASHERYMKAQLERNDVSIWQGVASFLSPHELEVTGLTGNKRNLQAPLIVIATGSEPRTPEDVPIDHEHILDSDSILSLVYLPESLTVLGSGVIACEYAAIFAALGVRVTQVDRAPFPLGFMDPEIAGYYLRELEQRGGRFLGERKIDKVAWDNISAVETQFSDGQVLRSEKLFCALGRLAQVAALNLKAAGVKLSPRGVIEVDRHGRTSVPHIYAAGDVVGPPALASTSMDQGRRAVCHALGVETGKTWESTPIGIFSIPELASVGLSEKEARERHGGAWVGRANFSEIARCQISAAENGLLKLIAHPESGKVLGVQVAGEAATELVHLGQLALLGEMGFETFIDNVFNFPTFAEAYRVAAFDILGQKQRQVAASRAEAPQSLEPV